MTGYDGQEAETRAEKITCCYCRRFGAGGAVYRLLPVVHVGGWGQLSIWDIYWSKHSHLRRAGDDPTPASRDCMVLSIIQL
jgi:hypothetical protein